ncbi:DHS-like NAD/FAD-binding domain containing protein [Elaphomyces granulatus]
MSNTLSTRSRVALDVDSTDNSYVDDLSDMSDLSSPPASPQTPPGFYPSPPPSNDQLERDWEQPHHRKSSGPRKAKQGAANQIPNPDRVHKHEPDQHQHHHHVQEHPDGEGPITKRRRVGPKPRTTQHLDLSRPASDISSSSSSLSSSPSSSSPSSPSSPSPPPPLSSKSSPAKLEDVHQKTQIDLLVKTLRTRRKIVVIAGAGISTSAGIPDFRSKNGLFKSVQRKHNLKSSGKLLFDAAVYRDNLLTASFHEMVRSLSEEASRSSPTAFHHMLARLAQDNRLIRLYTQNIDCIETSMPPLATQVPLNAKAPWPRTIQLHGSLDKMVCQKCRHLSDFQRELFHGPDAPLCPACSETDAVRTTTGQRSHGVGKLRPRIVLYNEHNPDEEAIASVMNADTRSRPDALVVVGTSLKIPGVRRLVKNLCHVVRGRRNGVTMWINNEPPTGREFEDCWDLMVKGDCEEVARLVGLKRWDDETPDVFVECDSSEVEQAKKNGPITVVVPNPTNEPEPINTGILTPSSSHDEAVKLPHKQPAMPVMLSNPASRGTSLHALLKTGRVGRPKKPGPKRSTSQKLQQKNQSAKITTFSKVTKSTTTNAEKTVKMEREESAKPMHPLPPGAARNNSLLFPNLVTKQDQVSSCGELWRNPSTISPPRIPKGMSDLLSDPGS